MKELKLKIDGNVYTAVFTGTDYDELKDNKRNDAVDLEYFPHDGWWAVHFCYKKNEDYVLCAQFKVDSDEDDYYRTLIPIGAQLLNEEGVIVDEYEIKFKN